LPTPYFGASCFDDSYDLVTGDNRQRPGFEVALDNLEVCAADSACLDPQEEFARAGCRVGRCARDQRRLLDSGRRFDQHCAH
jgi:hypothetical protein